MDNKTDTDHSLQIFAHSSQSHHNRLSSVTKKKPIIVLVILICLFLLSSAVFYVMKRAVMKPQSVSKFSPTSNSAESMTPSNRPSEQYYDEISVSTFDGDIVVSQKGIPTKITNGGIYSDPVLSPDNTKIAFISESVESESSAGADSGYQQTSTNVSIIDTDGSNLVQITKHINFVYRSALHWLDNDKLLFVDGEQSVRAYDSVTNTIQTVLGPEEAIIGCFDACGYSVRYIYSPDYQYLLRVVSGITPVKTAIVNSETLQSAEVQTDLSIDAESISFPDLVTVSFQASAPPDFDSVINGSIDLLTADVIIR